MSDKRCDCGHRRHHHANGTWECKWCRCARFREPPVPDIFDDLPEDTPVFDKATISSGQVYVDRRYRHVSLDHLVGKTVQAVGHDEVEGPYGMEPCTVLFFTDATCHGFVHPPDED
jgi:hypothetical protein